MALIETLRGDVLQKLEKRLQDKSLFKKVMSKMIV